MKLSMDVTADLEKNERKSKTDQAEGLRRAAGPPRSTEVSAQVSAD